jgi:hypothetical protein
MWLAVGLVIAAAADVLQSNQQKHEKNQILDAKPHNFRDQHDHVSLQRADLDNFKIKRLQREDNPGEEELAEDIDVDLEEDINGHDHLDIPNPRADEPNGEPDDAVEHEPIPPIREIPEDAHPVGDADEDLPEPIKNEIEAERVDNGEKNDVDEGNRADKGNKGIETPLANAELEDLPDEDDDKKDIHELIEGEIEDEFTADDGTNGIDDEANPAPEDDAKIIPGGEDPNEVDSNDGKLDNEPAKEILEVEADEDETAHDGNEVKLDEKPAKEIEGHTVTAEDDEKVELDEKPDERIEHEKPDEEKVKSDEKPARASEEEPASAPEEVKSDTKRDEKIEDKHAHDGGEVHSDKKPHEEVEDESADDGEEAQSDKKPKKEEIEEGVAEAPKDEPGRDGIREDAHQP